jgi:predicted phage gp36 major capsid-like protein
MTKKPLTPQEQLKNLCDGLAEDALADDKPLTKEERKEAAELRSRLIKFAEDHWARLEREKTQPAWEKRAAKKKGPPGSGYVM